MSLHHKVSERAGILFIFWFILINILFFLPGSDLPHNGWLQGWHPDKFVHVFLFAVTLYLWRLYAEKPGIILLIVMSLAYGFAIEFIQKYWIPNRDFDLYDVLADMGGALMGLWLSHLYKKNRPL